MSTQLPKMDELIRSMTSDSAEEVSEGASTFDSWIAQGRINPVAQGISRALQEMTLIDNGGLLKKVLRHVCGSPREGVCTEETVVSLLQDFTSQPETLRSASARVLQHLSASKVVVDFCIAQPGVTRKLHDVYMTLILQNFLPGPTTAANAPRKVDDTLAVEGLSRLAVLAHFCKDIRALIMDRSNPGYIPVLVIYVRAAFQMELCVLEAVSEAVAFFLWCLSSSQDTHDWLIEQGVVEIIVDLYRANSLTHGHEQRKKSYTAAKCLFLTLINLLERKKSRTKLKARDAYGSLSKVSQIMNDLYKGYDVENFWASTEGVLRDGEDVACLREFTAGRKMSARNRVIGLPTVCAYPECTAEEYDEATAPKFSRCARCLRAPYCSKEHQKAHWSVHKKLCCPLASNLESFA